MLDSGVAVVLLLLALHLALRWSHRLLGVSSKQQDTLQVEAAMLYNWNNNRHC
jgi:hypothetical protein